MKSRVPVPSIRTKYANALSRCLLQSDTLTSGCASIQGSCYQTNVAGLAALGRVCQGLPLPVQTSEVVFTLQGTVAYVCDYSLHCIRFADEGVRCGVVVWWTQQRGVYGCGHSGGECRCDSWK
jgi:hypothetical protein